MSDDWKTPSEPRLIGHLRDASGHSVAISAERNVVVIRHGGLAIHLRAAERNHFQQVFMQAEREAGAWAAEQARAHPRARCEHRPDYRCVGCATDEEMLAAIPPAARPPDDSRPAPVSDLCSYEAVFSDYSISCTFPRGHEGRHSYITAPEADVVTAEIWCGNPGECVNGPDGHLWADGSCRERQTPVSDPCTFEATFTDRDNIPCAWPRGHTGLHSWMPVP